MRCEGPRWNRSELWSSALQYKNRCGPESKRPPNFLILLELNSQTPFKTANRLAPLGALRGGVTSPDGNNLYPIVNYISRGTTCLMPTSKRRHTVFGQRPSC